MSDSEEERPASDIWLSEENWIILKEFLHKEIDKYLDHHHKRKCRICRGCVVSCYLCSGCAFAFMHQFSMQRQKLLDWQQLKFWLRQVVRILVCVICMW